MSSLLLVSLVFLGAALLCVLAVVLYALWEILYQQQG